MSRKRRHGVSCRRRSTGSRRASGVGSSFDSAVDAIGGNASARSANQRSDAIRSVAPELHTGSGLVLGVSKPRGRLGIASVGATSLSK
jgi:hypothetical protein